ncbi:hypothetical protein BDV3_001312 [Batrachochytrium dendrobatidis]
MECLEPLDLSVAQRPVLLKNETIFITTKDVCLYFGNQRLIEFNSGLVYVTSHRIMWVNETRHHAVQLHLAHIRQIDYSNGFLRSSPKIILDLLPSEISALHSTSPTFISFSKSTQDLVYNPSQSTESILPEWKCEVCDEMNGANAAKCAMCGVPNTNSPIPNSQAVCASFPQTKTTSTAASNEWTCEICDAVNTSDVSKCRNCGVQTVNSSNHNIISDINSSLPSKSTQIKCTACTFLNHPDLTSCEICNAPLSSASQLPESNPSDFGSSPIEDATQSKLNLKSTGPGSILKLSFRGGGMTDTLKHIKQVVAVKAWEKVETPTTPNPSISIQPNQASIGGVSGIIRNVEQTRKQMNDTVGDAFSDLENLMENAAQMVKLAESISNKLASLSIASDSSEMLTFRNYLNEIGISNPVTKESAGDMFIQELSRQLTEFLDQMRLAGHSEMIPLTDLYCLFNRARGVALISPDDLYKSVVEFERLKLPFRLRKFDSGLLVVQSISYSDEEVASKILKLVAERQTGLTAVELAKLTSISIVLAAEQLLMTEQVGLTCRDDTLEGLFFYPNLFT